MTELTYLWDGTTTGDATEAPYTATYFNRWAHVASASNDKNKVQVIPGYLNDLMPEAAGQSAYAAVIIRSGAAFVNNILYVNDQDKTFSIPQLSDTDLDRIDSVVLQADYINKKVRLAYLQGVEAATPSSPLLTQEDNLWEVEVCRIYVDAYPYVFTGARLNDRRVFLPTLEYPTIQSDNLIKNSEFISWYGAANLPGTQYVPAKWHVTSVGNPTLSVETFLAPMSRGRMVGITSTSTAHQFYQDIQVTPGKSTFSIVGILQDDSPDAIKVEISATRTNGLAASKSFETGIVGGLGTTDEPTQVFKYTFTFDEDDISELRVAVSVDTFYSGSSAVFKLGQLILVEGYYVGQPRPVHELIMGGLGPASIYTGFKSTSNFDLDYSDFDDMWTEGAVALLVYVSLLDSGSAARADIHAQVRHIVTDEVFLEVQLAGVANNTYRTRGAFVPVDAELHDAGNSLVPAFNVAVVASGVDQAFIEIDVLGIIT